MSDVNKLLIIIRGVPGSGKSTLARALNWVASEDGLTASWFETDAYFLNEDGTYVWNQDLLAQAHQWCYNSVKDDMQDDIQQIVVSNTMTRKWEYEQYVKLAREHGYAIQVLDVHGEFNSKHVTRDVQDRYEGRWTPFDRQLLSNRYGGIEND